MQEALQQFTGELFSVNGELQKVLGSRSKEKES
jgi:hypothetical protein